MRQSRMLKKFRAGKFARVCNLGHFLPFFVRYAAEYSYDGLWLDLEHRAMDQREIQTLLALCHAYDIDCMVRPPTREATSLYRHLEDGASGFMFPLVSDAETARALVQATKYPPQGNRGMDGAGMDGDFGIGAFGTESTHASEANRETFTLMQIETLEALDNADEIAAVAGVDGLFLGPADLRLRAAGSQGSTEVTMESAIERVRRAASRHSTVWGITAGSAEALKAFEGMGAQIVPWGSDFALASVLRQASGELDGVLAPVDH